MKLTEGDLEILSHVVDGLSTDEIADKLDRSPNTIKSRKSRILSKLDARNMNEACFKSIHEIARWRRENGRPDPTVGVSPWMERR